MSTSSRLAKGEVKRRFSVRVVDEGPPAVRVVYTCRTCNWKSRPKPLMQGPHGHKSPVPRAMALKWAKYGNSDSGTIGVCPGCTKNRDGSRRTP